ncbi:MAG: galactosyldiacylglycerol synthase [Acidobacteriota bacterium]|nr:galactosyldiacylglycerol synthase [Acidobacteriota bacterium]
MKRAKITLIYIDSGGGHRAAANALCEVARLQDRPWDIELVCIQDLLDSIDFIRKSTGIRFQEVYNIMLRRGWTLGTRQLIPVMHGLIRVSHPSQVGILESYWRGRRPDLVLSLIPHYNRALKQSLDRVWPGAPYVTLLTDIADYPPHFWIERIDQWVICGSPRAVEQARRIGLPPSRILQASGMVLHPRFYEPLAIDRAAELLRRGLDPARPTALVLFGGEGSTSMLRIAHALNHPDSGLQLIFLCGRNDAVAAQLRALPPRVPIFVEGFTREIPLYMELADFFIGKPGPGSISEALVKRLPVIVQSNAWTMAHERYNAEWVREIGAGIAVENFTRDLLPAVRELLVPENFARYRDRAAATRNRAVFEIPDMLGRILDGVSGSRPDPAMHSAA